MMKRAAVCIGVDRAGKMTQLQAAVKGAKEFEDWAKTQNCTTKLLVDEQSNPVTLNHIFTAVSEFVAARTYDVLVIYFSGHGILIAPGAEYWLLSQSPQNPNEAVNLSRSVEDARNSGIPHIVFVSDACRSAAGTPPLSGVTGGGIFPNQALVGQPSEVDVYYAARPGNPAWEAPEAEATKGYNGIFTGSLLKVVMAPKADLVESVMDGTQALKVISSRKLKEYLEATVPIEAAAINIKLRQNPYLHVETALPKFFAVVEAGTAAMAEGAGGGASISIGGPVSGQVVVGKGKHIGSSPKPVQLAFLSYAREDAEFVLRLAKDLRAGGADVWIDQLDIKPGQRWNRAVEDPFAKCPELLVILSPAAVESINVLDEVSLALEEGKTVVPVLHRQCKIPFRLRRLRYVDLSLNYKAGLGRLLETLSVAAPGTANAIVPPAPAAPPSIDSALNALSAAHFETGIPPSAQDVQFAQKSGLTDELKRLAETRGRARFETRTGFSVFGARPLGAYALRWQSDQPFPDDNNDPTAWHIRLHPEDGYALRKPSTLIIEFDSGTGTPLAILPGFIGTVVVDRGRVTSVSYVPSDQSGRFSEYAVRAKEFEDMKALAAVAARYGRFVVEGKDAAELANRIRQGKGLDPTLGIFAAYAYAQVGKYKDVNSVFTYMRDDEIELPVPFDVVMLATRYENNKGQAEQERYAPFCPMLAQGWALLMEGDPLFNPIHKEVRPHLLPSLWTTLGREGVEIIRKRISTGKIK